MSSDDPDKTHASSDPEKEPKVPPPSPSPSSPPSLRRMISLRARIFSHPKDTA